jgi:carbamoyl-phosphate synthase large subunit
MKYNILITSVGGDIGGNIVNILNEQNLFKCSITGIDIKNHVFSEVDLKHFYQVSRVDNPNYINQLKDIICKHTIDLIIPSSEYDILFLQEHIIFFKKLNVKLLINNQNIVNTFLNKYETAKVLNKLKITTPKTFNLNEYNNELVFPLILKASSSTTSKMIKKVHNNNELIEVKATISDKNKFIIQEYIGIENEEYTTAVYRDKAITKVITFKRLLDGDKTGYAEIAKSPILENYAIKIAQDFNLEGSINIQSRKYNHDFYIFEINPRISSTVYIRNHFKFEDLIWWIVNILDINVDFSLVRPKECGVAILGYSYRFYNEETMETINETR